MVVVPSHKRTRAPWRWLAAELDAYHRWLQGLGGVGGTVISDPPPPAPTGGPWVCIADAETGGVPASGPTYWTVFGVVSGVVTEYGTPAEQHDIFTDTASFGEQLDVVTRFAAVNGFGGWGVLTRQKCGL